MDGLLDLLLPSCSGVPPFESSRTPKVSRPYRAHAQHISSGVREQRRAPAALSSLPPFRRSVDASRQGEARGFPAGSEICRTPCQVFATASKLALTRRALLGSSPLPRICNQPSRTPRSWTSTYLAKSSSAGSLVRFLCHLFLTSTTADLALF